MKQIPLTHGRFAIVDDEDFDLISQHKWLFSKRYAMRRLPREKGKVEKWVYMHRVINKTPQGFITDHINRNTLDNQKKNLRTVTSQQNNFNFSLAKNNTSGIKGVTKNNKKWQAQIQLKGKNIYLGLFYDFQKAVLARKRAEGIYHAIA